MINSFRGKNRFLSNFYLSEIAFEVNGEWEIYPSSEHAYQALKFEDVNIRKKFMDKGLTPGNSKKLARKYADNLYPHWDRVKYEVMSFVLYEKFKNSELRRKLLETGDQILVEGNTWGDVYWGVCNGTGENNLGKLLMLVREFYRDMENS